jgi:hypothetical protein
VVAPQIVSFQTGNGPDTTAPVVVFRSPDNGETVNVPTNVTLKWVFNEPLDPASVNAANVFVYTAIWPYTYASATPALGADGKTVTLTVPSGLEAGQPYQACAYSLLDLTGNVGGGVCSYFTTSTTVSATAPFVVATNPLSGATGAATQPLLEVVFDRQIDTTTLGQISLTAQGGAVPVSVTLSSSYYYLGATVLQLRPFALLDPNTTYTVTIAGVQDLSGNAMSAPFTFSFTTGADPQLAATSFLSATVMANGVQTTLVSGQTVSGVDPSASAVTLTFSDAVDIVSVLNHGALVVADATNAVVPIGVTMSADGRTATLTPLSPLDAGTQYRLEAGYNVAFYDQTGNYVSGYGVFRFITQ